MTQYEKALEKYGKDQVTMHKGIKDYCPSDILRFGVDDCDGEKETDKCEKCWGKQSKVFWIELEYISYCVDHKIKMEGLLNNG